MRRRILRRPLVLTLALLMLLLSVIAGLYYLEKRVRKSTPTSGLEPTTSKEPSQLPSDAYETLVPEKILKDFALSTATLHYVDFESGAFDLWKQASTQNLSLVVGAGHSSTTGLAVTIDAQSSYVYQDDLACAEEAYLAFWFNPNGADLMGDALPRSRAVRIAEVIGPDGTLVALSVYRSPDQSYKAYLEWSDESNDLQLDDLSGQFDLENGWQRITLGYRVDDWIAAWVNDQVRREIGVTHVDPYGMGVRLGRLDAADDVRLNGTILFDDIAFQVPQVVDLWVDMETGEDANRGQSPEQAFRTIQKAADVAGPGTTVHIMPGVYREAVRPAMSGSGAEPVRYVAENGPGTVSIRGSEPASSLAWSQLTENSIGLPPGIDPANIYYADLSTWELDGPPRFIVELDGAGDIASQLWPAREPDWQVATEWKQHEFWWFADGGSTVASCDPTTDPDPHCDYDWRSYTQLIDTSDDADPAGIEPGNLTTLGNLSGATLVAMDAQHAHYVYRRTIVAHDVAAGRISVDEDCNNDGRPGLGWGSKYYIENHPALLDEPGEWWFDANTGHLYLWTPTGENPATLNLEISRLDTGFDLQNRSYVSLDGLTIELFNGDAYAIINNNPWYKAHGNTLKSATLRYANRGVFLYQLVNRETPQLYAVDGFLLEGSEIAYMDTVGMEATYWWPDAPKPDQFSHAGVRNTVIRNNELHHLGLNSEHRSAFGIRILFPDSLRFEGNHVHHVAQNGVNLHLSLIDSSKEYDFSPEEIILGEILIKDNVFEKACQLASDCGALKLSGSGRPYTHVFRDVLITGNVLRDTFGWSYVSVKRGLNTIGDGNGFYLDHASGIHAYRNIAYNNTGAGFKLGCLWRDGNTVYYDNIAANNYSEGFELTGGSGSCDDHRGSVNTRLVNNILVNNDAHGIQFVSAYNNNNYGNLVIDHNLYYNNGWNEQAAWNPANIQLHQGSRPVQYFYDLAEIQAGTPWEDHGVEGDPAFIDYGLADHDRYDGSWPDFHITAASVNALNRGTADLPASLTRLLTMFDVEDVRLGSAFDIGRYEAAGAQATPATWILSPGATTQFTLSHYPPSFPDPLTLSVSSSPSDLTLGLSSTVLNPGETATLTITDHHDPSTPLVPALLYTITIAATHGEATQYTDIHLPIGGARFHLPLVFKTSP